MVAETDRPFLKQPEWPVSMGSGDAAQVVVVFRMEAWKLVKGSAFPIQQWWCKIVERIFNTIPDNSVDVSWRYYIEKDGSSVIEQAVKDLQESRAAAIWAWDGRGSEEAVCAGSFFGSLRVSENTCSTNYFYISDSDNPETSPFWTGSASSRSSGFSRLWQYPKAHMRLKPWEPSWIQLDVQGIYDKEPTVTQCRALPWSDTPEFEKLFPFADDLFPATSNIKLQANPAQPSGPVHKNVGIASLSSEASLESKIEPLETLTDTDTNTNTETETDADTDTEIDETDKDIDEEAMGHPAAILACVKSVEGKIDDDFLSFLERALSSYERSKAGCHKSLRTRGTSMPASSSPSYTSTTTAISSESQEHNPAERNWTKGTSTGADVPQRSTRSEALSVGHPTSIAPPIMTGQQTSPTHQMHNKDASRYESQTQVGALNGAIVMIELNAWEHVQEIRPQWFRRMIDKVWASLEARGLPVNFIDIHFTCQEGSGVRRMEELIETLGWKKPPAFWDQEGYQPLQSANHFRRLCTNSIAYVFVTDDDEWSHNPFWHQIYTLGNLRISLVHRYNHEDTIHLNNERIFIQEPLIYSIAGAASSIEEIQGAVVPAAKGTKKYVAERQVSDDEDEIQTIQEMLRHVKDKNILAAIKILAETHQGVPERTAPHSSSSCA